jgi:uncharacterized protein
MQWQTDPVKHVSALNRGPARQDRGVGTTGDGFVYSPTAWEAYEANKPVADKDVPKKNEHKLWTIGERLERSNLGQSTHELPSSLLSTVYGLLAFSMAFTAAGIVAGYHMRPNGLWFIVFANLALIFAIIAWREVEYLNLVLLYGFCVSIGLMLGPLIAELASAGMLDLVVQAALATGALTGCLFVTGRRIEQDLYGWQPFLFAGLLAFIILQLANQLLFNTPIDQLLVGFSGVVLFSAYLIFDINRVRHVEDTMGNAVIICLDIYLDIINLFLNLLQIFIEIAGEGD